MRWGHTSARRGWQHTFSSNTTISSHITKGWELSKANTDKSFKSYLILIHFALSSKIFETHKILPSLSVYRLSPELDMDLLVCLQPRYMCSTIAVYLIYNCDFYIFFIKQLFYIVFVLEREEGYTVKYGLSPCKILRA